VKERLAACVKHHSPHILLLFRGRGKLGQEKEVLILGKTKRENEIKSLT